MVGDDINSFDGGRVSFGHSMLNTDPGRKLPACDQQPDPIGNLQVKAAWLDDLDRHQKHWHHTLMHLESKV
jgi:hypothetical protein